MWGTTGIVRAGKTYCTIEETLFLTEIGALLVVDEIEKPILLKDIFEKVAQEVNGCSWEHIEAYKQLKALGYVVGRHGVPWTTKSKDVGSAKEDHVIELFNNMHINEGKPAFDVYFPNSKFRKSSPGDPSFALCLCRSDHPPSEEEIKAVERQCGGSIALKFCQIENGRVSLFSFNKVELPVLP